MHNEIFHYSYNYKHLDKFKKIIYDSLGVDRIKSNVPPC